MKLLNKEEAMKIAKEIWEHEDMQQYYVSKYDFYQLSDGLVMELEKVNKISIDKTIYYDDETDAPTINEENFLYYNRSNYPARNLDAYLEEKENLFKNGCASGRYDYNGIYLRKAFDDNNQLVHCSWFDEKDKYFKRYLTKEEEQDFITLANERQEKYIERLKKYFKRYAKNVTTYGYWANR